MPVKTNVSESTRVQVFFDRAKSSFGRSMHILVTCVGFSTPQSPAQISRTETPPLRSILERGFLYCQEGKRRQVDGGSVITSDGSVPRYEAYMASKAAMEIMEAMVWIPVEGAEGDDDHDKLRGTEAVGTDGEAQETSC
ncbi:NADPH-dependent aldehyde reductase-like protein, chloroplastic [Typha angustifolia]|uniref:NADPH-dependent aldehyde reductase-like protein, chloroplastic n=1 Tax=Typha angustifolia TaxID=59011 RepID=UPI003C2BD143